MPATASTDLDGRLLNYMKAVGVLRVTPEAGDHRFVVSSLGGTVHLAPIELIELGVELIQVGTRLVNLR